MIAVFFWLIILVGLIVFVVKGLKAENGRANRKPVNPRPLLARLTRAELNDRAAALGISDAARMRTKADVVEAIALQQKERIAASAARTTGYEVT